LAAFSEVDPLSFVSLDFLVAFAAFSLTGFALAVLSLAFLSLVGCVVFSLVVVVEEGVALS
jgi:hypothetical protein